MVEMRVGNILIGDSHDVVVIAELGTNFEDDATVAKYLLDQAKASGASMAKLECFVTENVYRVKAMKGKQYTYGTAKGQITEDWMTHLGPKGLPLDLYEEIFAYANNIGFPIFSSVYNHEMMERTISWGGCAVKIASCNVFNLPLIEHAGKLGVPVFLDTGHSELHHIARAVSTAKRTGLENFLLMHNPPGPRPTPPAMHHFRVMQSYREIFELPIGFTCHYRGDEMVCAAVALGAHAIEKSISRDPDRMDSEYVFSMVPEEFSRTVQKCKNVRIALGKRMFDPKDILEYHIERLSPTTKRNIRKGERLSLDNVTFKRPCGSITPDYWSQMDGKTVRVDIEADELIQWGHLEIDDPS